MAVTQTWVVLDKMASIEDGVTAFRKKRKNIAVFKQDNEIIRVFEDNCPHNEKIKISDDFILKDRTITCRFHGACWKLADGETVRGPGGEGLNIYSHRITDDGKLEILLD